MHWNELDIVEGTISKGRGKAAILPQKMIEKGIVVRATIKSQSRRDPPTYVSLPMGCDLRAVYLD